MSGRVFSASSNAVWYTRMFRAVGWAALREGMEGRLHSDNNDTGTGGAGLGRERI